MWCIFRANFSVMCLKHPRCPGLGCHIDSLVRASCHQLTTASSFSCCSRRLCHRCTPARETASQDCTLWQRMSLSSETTTWLLFWFSQVFECNHWQMLLRQKFGFFPSLSCCFGLVPWLPRSVPKENNVAGKSPFPFVLFQNDFGRSTESTEF